MKEMLIIKKQINARRPKFVRQEGTSKRMLQKVGWRKPKGYHSKIRRKFAGHRKMPNVGYRSPLMVRGMTMEGLFPKVVYNLADAAKLVAGKDIAVVAAVSKKAKVEILKQLMSAKIRIQNILDPQRFIADVEDEIKKRKEIKNKREEHKKKSKEESLKKAEEKKKEKKEEKTEEELKKENEEEQRQVLKKGQ